MRMTVHAVRQSLFRRRLTVCALVICLLMIGGPGSGQDFTIQLELGGRLIEGSPLAWSASDVQLLSRDGHLWSFRPQEAKNFRRTADGFESYSQGEMRAQLAREFGPRFDVSGTGNYLVVHPAGQRDQWASRFEQLYRSFVHYFAARGLHPQKLRFPLVAVVFPRQQDFLRYASGTGVRLIPGTLGYYSPTTNRILLYDVTAGLDQPRKAWHINADTIIHEAAHQSAFNGGIHSRYALPPRWLVEGLGTMFEARGVWNSLEFVDPADRINRDRLHDFKHYAATRRPSGSLQPFVSFDRLFASDPEAAYAEAWALTFFLVETRPRQYAQYLRVTAARKDFTPYRSPERLRDFTDIFGQDLAMLEARFLRFIGRLK